MAQKFEIAKDEEQVVVFQLADQTYGMDIAAVSEIIRMEKVTYVPRAPEFVEGVINLRGRIIPVIDLRGRFGLKGAEHTRQSRIIVVEMAGVTVGLIVDAVLEVLRIPAESIEPPPAMVDGVDVAYLRGIALFDGRMIILLNLEKILEEDEKETLGEAEAAAEVTV
ncbi:MAG TPA: chemotaxis protein CheW [Desulfotomaculum sp.]|nr:chemotaxis protein CheW [Desulfotomaculum sp.]